MARGLVWARYGSALQTPWGEVGKWPATTVAEPGGQVLWKDKQARDGGPGVGAGAADPASLPAWLQPGSRICGVSRTKVRLVRPFSEPRLLPIPPLLFWGQGERG